MAKKLPELNLPSADSLFSTQEERDDAKREKVQNIPLSEIDAFPEHPFLVQMDEAMQAMVDSVKTVGIQTPAVVRRKEDRRHELISGHRRKMASELAELDTLPCIVRDLTCDEAIIAMVDANLQREIILPSEKAKSYKMKLEAMKRQGQRTDLTSTPPAGKSRGKETAEIVGEAAGDSKDQVRRYVRLTELIPPVLELVDSGKLAMRSAVELSYLPTEQQQSLAEAIESEDSVPSHVQASKIRQFSDNKRLNNDVILSILQEEAPLPAEQFKIPKASISRFFAPSTPADKIQETIIKALELWHKSQKPRPE